MAISQEEVRQELAKCLFSAIVSCDAPRVHRLLKQGIPADAWGLTDSQGRTPFQLAGALGNPDVVSLFSRRP